MTDAQRAWLCLTLAVQHNIGVDQARAWFSEELRRYERMR